MSVGEVHDVFHVWIELRPPKKGELAWSVPADASPEEALAQVLVERDDDWAAGEAGFGCRTLRDGTPEFEEAEEGEGAQLRVRNIVVHVKRVPTPFPISLL